MGRRRGGIRKKGTLEEVKGGGKRKGGGGGLWVGRGKKGEMVVRVVGR